MKANRGRARDATRRVDWYRLTAKAAT